MTTKKIKELPNGELFIEFTPEEMAEVGWETGDTIKWTDNGDGSWTMSKKDETEWVMVECISTYRMRYCVEVPKGHADYALDTVTMNEAKEFSQLHLGETIVSHRVISEEEAFKMCVEDNDYVSTWNDEHIKDVFFTKDEK